MIASYTNINGIPSGTESDPVNHPSHYYTSTTTTTPCDININDPVNHPSHYTQGGIECLDAISAACTGLNGQEGFYVGQVIKYVWRYKKKNNPVEDLKKANFYLAKLIEYTESNKENTK